MDFIELASGAIIDKLKSVLDQDVAVADLTGNIVADSEIKNFGRHVPSTREAVRESKTLRVPGGELGDQTPAWATPLVYDNQTVGSLILKDPQSKMTEEQVALAKSLAELLIHQVMVLKQLPTTSQVLDKFFFDLFEGPESDRARLLDQSRFLDVHYYKIGLDRDRLIVLVNFPGFWQKLLGTGIVPQEAEQAKIEHYKQTLTGIFRPYVENPADILVTYFSGDNFTILMANDKDALKQAQNLAKNAGTLPGLIKNSLDEDAYVALPNFHPKLDGLLTAYGQARTTLTLGKKLNPSSSILSYSDIIMPRLINLIPKAEQQYFVNYYLKGLLHKPQLMKTLAAYFSADLDLKATAAKLNIHKNTLYYRFDKIQKLIDLDPRSFHNAVKIMLALLMYQINLEDQADGTNSHRENQVLFG